MKGLIDFILFIGLIVLVFWLAGRWPDYSELPA